MLAHGYIPSTTLSLIHNSLSLSPEFSPSISLSPRRSSNCMAVRFLAREVSDLCLGKPALTALPASAATVADALSALKRSGESHVSVWACCENNHDHSDLCSPAAKAGGECRCVGKICMVDVICFLCREKNLVDPSAALRAPVSDLLDKAGAGIVRHLEPHSRFVFRFDSRLMPCFISRHVV